MPYLIVKNGKKAIALYEEIFGAKVINHQPFSKEMGMHGIPADFDFENSTMHAELEISGATIYISDNPVSPKFESSGNVEVYLELDSKKQLEKFYKKAKEKGSVIKMELQKTFWGSFYTRLQDPEGVGWQLGFQPEGLVFQPEG